MSLLQYTIVNQSAIAKTFTYFSASVSLNINVGGFDTIVFEGDASPSPTQLLTGIPEEEFVSDAYIPPSGSAWLWNNGDKVQYVKISNTPLTGSDISKVLTKAEWIEFSMVEAIDKNGNFIFPTSPNSARVERYIINNSRNRGTYNSIVINSSSPESSNAVAANTASAETGFSYVDNQFEIDQDCNPLLNNATEPRLNEKLQDVDYSVNAITPINFDQLINFTANKASVPQSNYTQLGFVHSRYEGSSTTRARINEYDPLSSIDIENKLLYSDGPSSFFVNKGKGAPLGKVPNVELNNAFIAYFNRIVDPYPQLNNKVAYYVKYLIDESGNILDPNISDINFSTLTNTFQLRDYDNSPTRVNTAISNIEEGRELTKLTNGLHSVHKVGVYPVPILYTQTSSIGHANEISLSGSQFFSALGLGKDFLKFGIDISAEQVGAAVPPNKETSVNLFSNNSFRQLQWEPADITPFENNNDPLIIPTSSISPTCSILFPLDPSGSLPNELGGILSDNYTVRGNFKFSTSTIPAVYKAGGNHNSDETKFIENYLKLRPNSDERNATKRLTFNLRAFVKNPDDDDLIINYENTNEGFNVTGVKLIITTNPGRLNEKVESPLTIEANPGQGQYGTQWAMTPSSRYPGISQPGLRFTPDSTYIEKLIIENIFKSNIKDENARRRALSLIAGGWSGFPSFGVGALPIKYDWVIEFEFTNARQNTGLLFEANGSILEGLTTKNILGRPNDVFLFFENRGRPSSIARWRRTFNPVYTIEDGTINSNPTLNFSVTSPLSENAVENAASGPFWRRVPNTTDRLYMSSSILNQTYGKPFVQAKLPYSGSINTDFPLTIEPGFIEFDAVTDFWRLEIGDEIRFENNENLTFTIVGKINEEDKNRNSENIADKLQVVVDPPFESINKQPSNFDFFVVRRYKENKNFIILDQQMPYGITSTGKGEIAFSGEDASVGIEPVNPSSSPGLLLPQHRVGKFNINPDLVLKDLVEKGIIT
jgi:hypothetical protein